jgi:hypothetical protein
VRCTCDWGHPHVFGPVTPVKGSSTSTPAPSLTELRLWHTARTPEEIQDNMYTGLAGDEKGLVGYWTLDEGNGDVIEDRRTNGNHATISAAAADGFWQASGAPIGNEVPRVRNTLPEGAQPSDCVGTGTALSGAEYGDLQTNAKGLLRGVLKRCYAYINADRHLALLTGFKVGDLAMDYLGQVQTRPTLIGYIEGAPPLPSENLTQPYWTSATGYQSYVGTSSVKLIEADHTTSHLLGR